MTWAHVIKGAISRWHMIARGLQAPAGDPERIATQRKATLLDNTETHSFKAPALLGKARPGRPPSGRKQSESVHAMGAFQKNTETLKRIKCFGNALALAPAWQAPLDQMPPKMQSGMLSQRPSCRPATVAARTHVNLKKHHSNKNIRRHNAAEVE